MKDSTESTANEDRGERQMISMENNSARPQKATPSHNIRRCVINSCFVSCMWRYTHQRTTPKTCHREPSEIMEMKRGMEQKNCKTFAGSAETKILHLEPPPLPRNMPNRPKTTHRKRHPEFIKNKLPPPRKNRQGPTATRKVTICKKDP